MRMSKMIVGLLGLALFVLLLSALVVCPVSETAAADAAPLTGLSLMPLSMPSAMAEDLMSMRLDAPRMLGVSAVLLFVMLPVLFPRRDANGRVLRARRYVSSFYQLFRQEVAGG